MAMLLPNVGRLSLVVLCFMACCTGTEALQWVTSAQNGTLLQACSGSNFTFPWHFTLETGEQLEDIKWLYVPKGSSASTPELVANYIYGHFITMPPFTNRLVYLGNGDLSMSHVTPADAGTYIVEVVTTHNANTGYQSNRRYVVMQVFEVPAGVDSSRWTEVGMQAVPDKVSGDWHVVLTCGHFLLHTHPEPQVVWETPTGSELTSSYSQNGTYFLKVSNPVSEGDYVCKVTYPSSIARCLWDNTSLTHEASLHLDAATARLILLEAKQEALLGQNLLLTDLRDKLAHTDSVLTQTQQDLNTTMSVLSNTTRELTMTKNVLASLRGDLTNMQTELNDLRNCCRAKEIVTKPTENTTPSVNYVRDVRHQLTETQYRLNDLRGDLTDVRGKVDELKECCVAASLPPVDHTPYMKPDLPDPLIGDITTSSLSGDVTEDVTTVPHITKETVTRKTVQRVSTAQGLTRDLKMLTNHVRVVESRLQQLQAQANKRIAFHAQASYQQYNNNDHVQFSEEVFTNDGNAFNKSSGEFIVPVNGVYVFLASTSAYGVYGSSCNADLMVDDRAVARMLGKYMNSYDQVTGHAVMHLRRGQRVWVRSIGATAIDSRSIFSGFLLKPGR